MNGIARALVLVSIATLLACIVGLLYVERTARNGEPQASAFGALMPDENVLDLAVTPFRLQDQDGVEVTEACFTGRLTVVDFIFTRCPFICPTLTAVMLDLQDRLADTPARFISLSVDPDHDTPDVLRSYAADRGADLSRWSLLTGDKTSIWAMLRDGFKWGIEEDAATVINLPDGGSMANIRHPGWLALIGPDGRPLAIYSHSDPEDVSRLEARVRAASRQLQGQR